MTEAFYNWVGCSREYEWRAAAEHIFVIDAPENCREVAEATKKLCSDGYEALAISIAQSIVVSEIETELLVRIAEHAFWNFDLWASVTEPSQEILKRRDFYFKKLEVSTKELHKRRVAGDKAVRDAEWQFESRYLYAAAMLNRVDEMLDMMLVVPEGKLSYRAGALAIAKLFMLAIMGEGCQEGEKDAIFDKVMARMNVEKMRNLLYTFYQRAKSADGKERDTAMFPAGLLLFWYDQKGDFVEARNFLDDSRMGVEVAKHLDGNIAAAGACTEVANATIGAAVFTSLCIGLYSFTIHAATKTSADHGVPLFAWYTVPAVVVGFAVFHAITDSDSASPFGRAWQLTKIWWLFLFFALPLFPVATSFLASVVFFFLSLYAYPRYRGWA